MTLCPAAPKTGIVFQRVDQPGKPEIPASLQYVKEWPRCTRLISENTGVQMVEHLLSSLSAYGIDNLRIELTGPEIPSLDGSSLPFVEAIEKAGIKIQDTKRRYLKIEEPVYWSENEVHLIGLPSDQFQISYTLHYPQAAIIGSQYFAFSLTDPHEYKKEIAPCRTFSLYEEIAPMIEKGFLKGGGLENALVIKGGKIMNPDGARFSDEMVRHKVLDLIGDLALIGMPILGHVIAIRSGHSSNLAFAKKLLKGYLSREEHSHGLENSYLVESR